VFIVAHAQVKALFDTLSARRLRYLVSFIFITKKASSQMLVDPKNEVTLSAVDITQAADRF
jgi:hypothetical protein